MKHYSLAALPLVALLALTGACSSGEAAPAPTPSQSVDVTAQPTEAPLTKEERVAEAENAPEKAKPEPSVVDQREAMGQADDALFLEALRSSPTGVGGLSDAEILTLAKGTCDRLNAGENFGTLTLELAQSGQSEEQNFEAVNVMVAGMVNYCPDRYAETYPQ